MKWLFGFLILANIGLLMWGSWYHQPLVSLTPPSPRPVVAPEKLKLLSEPGVRLVVRPPTPISRSDTAARNCYRLGPFANVEQLRLAGSKLENWGVAYERATEYETQGVAYRVYLPPLASVEVAEARRRELTRLGFRDHALIQNETGMENAISLGLFSVEQNARARIRQLSTKGVKAAIQAVPNVRPIYWLALTGPAEEATIGPVPAARFAEEDWGTPGATLHQAACPSEPPSLGVAS